MSADVTSDSNASPSQQVAPVFVANRPLPPALLVIVALMAGIALLFPLLGSTVGQRMILSISLAIIFSGLLVGSPGVGVCAIVVFLAILGGLRRWLIPVLDYTGSDPLLLVVPAVLTLYLGSFAIRRKIVINTRFSRLMISLLLLMVIQVVNPLQGGLMIGFSGALFYIVPVLWYFLGRQIGTPQMLRQLLRVVVIVAMCGAFYGLKQMLFGLSDSEQMWLRITGFQQILANGSVRTLSFFTNGGEYSTFLGSAVVVLWVMFHKYRGLPAFLPIPLLIACIFLASYRSAVVSCFIALVVVWAMQGRTVRSWVPRFSLAVFVAIFGVTWSLQQIAQVSSEDEERQIAASDQSMTTAQLALNHQASGLLRPENSSATAHASQFTSGILGSLHAPLGLGLGSTTLGGAKYGDQLLTTEFDISNMFVALGPIGGVLYIVIIGNAIYLTGKRWVQTRSLNSLITMGFLWIYFGHWLEAGNTGFVIVWFSLGVLDRASPLPALEKEPAS